MERLLSNVFFFVETSMHWAKAADRKNYSIICRLQRDYYSIKNLLNAQGGPRMKDNAENCIKLVFIDN